MLLEFRRGSFSRVQVLRKVRQLMLQGGSQELCRKGELGSHTGAVQDGRRAHSRWTPCQAAATKYRELGGLEQQRLVLPQLCSLVLGNQGGDRAVLPLKVPERISPPCLFLGIPWLLAASLQSLPLSSFSSPFPPTGPSLLIRKAVLGFRAMLARYEFIIPDYICKDGMSKRRSHSEAPVGMNFVGTLFSPLQ